MSNSIPPAGFQQNRQDTNLPVPGAPATQNRGDDLIDRPVPSVEQSNRQNGIDRRNQSGNELGEEIQSNASQLLDRVRNGEERESDQRKQDELIDESQRNELVKRLNQNIEPYSRGLQFRIDEQYEEMVIQVYDRTQEEVIRQIPAEEALALADYLEEVRETVQSTVMGQQPLKSPPGLLLDVRS